MADDQRHTPEDIPPPKADALTPVRPTAKEQEIAMKVYIYIVRNDLSGIWYISI